MKQRGVALLAILLVVSIVTVLAVGIAHSNMVRLGLTQHRIESAQAWQVWQAGVEWSRDILRLDLRRNDYDYPDEFWGRGIRDYPAEGGRLSGRMIDQQGLFNLNNLVVNGRVSTGTVAVFQRLLSRLGLSPDLSDALVDWIDTDNTTLPNGAEDAAYASLRPPYRAANQPLTSIDELYWIKGFDAATVARLRPYVTVLPRNTTINVNSAPEAVLGALLPGLGSGELQDLSARLRTEPCSSLNVFKRLLPSDVQTDDAMLGVASQFFLLQLSVTYGDTRAEGEALLDRTSGFPVVVWRRRGLEQALDLTHPLSQSELTGGV